MNKLFLTFRYWVNNRYCNWIIGQTLDSPTFYSIVKKNLSGLFHSVHCRVKYSGKSNNSTNVITWKQKDRIWKLVWTFWPKLEANLPMCSKVVVKSISHYWNTFEITFAEKANKWKLWKLFEEKTCNKNYKPEVKKNISKNVYDYFPWILVCLTE